MQGCFLAISLSCPPASEQLGIAAIMQACACSAAEGMQGLLVKPRLLSVIF